MKTIFDPKLDLTFERKAKLTTNQFWQAWTNPETLKKWFCPKPWKVTSVKIDLQPGGEFFTLMEGPNGEKSENHGCYLSVVPEKQLIWTNVMTAGLRPNPDTSLGFPFVIKIIFDKVDQGTLYRATVVHADEASRKKHEDMGFQEGWGIAFKQLEELFL